MKNFIVGALIIGVAIVIGFLVAKPIIQYGASSGPDHSNLEYFHGGLVQGGEITTKTAGTSTTWTAADVCKSGVIKWIPSETTNTTTFPTAANLAADCLQNNGEFKDLILWNAGLTASATITFTANTGNTIFVATGTDAVIAGLNFAKVKFIRVATSTVKIFIDEEAVQ